MVNSLQNRIMALLMALITILTFPVGALAAEVQPFDEYGSFTNVNDEGQLRHRAEWYYQTFIADPRKEGKGAALFSIEEIMNDIRIMNGEFMRLKGQSIYNDTDVIAAANDLHTIANYDSFTQYGTQIFFTPTAPLFVDGSAAQMDAIIIDQAMEKVVAAIRAENNEAFMTAAQEWGNIVIHIFKSTDLPGEYASVYQVGAAEGFALYHAMDSKYASTILKYSEARSLTVMIDDVDLNQIMSELNEVPLDAFAANTVHSEKYADRNLSLPQDLCLIAKDYFTEKFYREATNPPA